MSDGLTLDKMDWKKILTGALIAAGGAGAIYALEYVGKINVGIYTPIAVAVSSVCINIIRKWISN